MLLTFALGIAAMVLAYRIGRKRAEQKRSKSTLRYFLTLIFPVAAMLVPVAVKHFVTEQFVIRGETRVVVTIALDAILVLAAVVVIFGACNRLAEVVIASPRIQPKGIDAQLIRLGFRVLGIVGSVALLFYGGQRLGIPMATLIAGAGVGGLAVALAAQDTLKNLFGSMMIVLDKPYRVGERIVTKGYDGVVEEIGLRSTKIRLLNGHQAAIPNEEMARIDIENIGRRPFIRRIQDIALAYDTPLDKVRRALVIVRSLLEDHEGRQSNFPPRVYFNEFTRDSLNLRIIYWYHPPNYWDFLAHSEKLNMAMMQEFEAAGIKLAVPATKTYMVQGGEGPLKLDGTGEVPRDESQG
jgi:MscS family membrane protein